MQWMLEKSEPLLIADASQDQRFPPEGIPLAGAGSCFLTRLFRSSAATST